MLKLSELYVHHVQYRNVVAVAEHGVAEHAVDFTLDNFEPGDWIAHRGTHR